MCLCLCVWDGYFLWPVWHLTHAVTFIASFSVSLTTCSAAGTEKSATLSSAAHTQHRLCFCLPCSPTEAAAGEGDRPEDCGGRSQWCKLYSLKISIVCKEKKKKSMSACLPWTCGEGISVIPTCLGIHITPAASVVQPNTNLQQRWIPNTHPFKCAALITVPHTHFL